MHEAFVDNLRSVHSATNLPTKFLDEWLREIGRIAPAEETETFAIVSGPLPDFPNTLIDVWIVTKVALINFTIDPDGGVLWYVIPLRQIAQFSVSRVGGEGGDWISIYFYGVSGVNALQLQDRADRWDHLLENFVHRLIQLI